MTKPCYPKGCEARSQACGLASSVVSNNSDYRWNVNFNNGTTNNINDNNNAWVRLVRGPVAALPREYQGVTVESLHRAYRAARYAKKPSHNQMRFEAFWMDGLRDLQQRIAAGTWTPAPTNCFITTRPKAREIHAPDFADRVVHHWLVPQLERVFDPGFIHDSFSNREGKGTHAAVTRLQGFVRQVQSGKGGGYFLQLDIKSFFNSIHRPTLWNRLKSRMLSAGVPVEAQRVTHALLRHAPVHQGVVHRSTPAERAAVPPHKRLENANPGCGLPIGNLSSQFFANVYLDALDQFVKHVLKVPRYVRYVDDFVLVHESREQLAIWQQQIEDFLRTELRLELKTDRKLLPLTQGIDFLGYVIYPTHSRVRRRVVSHLRERLGDWQQKHVTGNHIRAGSDQLKGIRSVYGSYAGHMQHASSFRLRQGLHRRYPWLHASTGVRRKLPHRNTQLAIQFGGSQ